ncbi:MAG: hypothetical protein MUF38_17625, partial [Anaerolineae bacterium]|nr:hypothetical protein [Anaerolineae bacterium]
ALYAAGLEYYHGRPYGISNAYWGAIDWSNVPVNSGYHPTVDIGQATCDIFTVLEAYSPDTAGYQAAQNLLKTAYWQTAVNNVMHRLQYGGFVGIFGVEEPMTPPTPDSTIYSSPDTRVMSLKDRLDMTRADLERFADDPRYGSVVRYQYAWALHDAGFDPDGAAAAYQAVIDHDPESPWARLAALKVE